MSDEMAENERTLKILIEMHQGIGDLIHMLPLIENIRLNYPDAIIAVIIASIPQKIILDHSGLVNEIYFFRYHLKNHIDLIIRLRREQYDLGFLAVNTNKQKGAFLLWLINCKKIVIESDKRYFGKRFITCEETKLHRVERNLNLARAAGIKVVRKVPWVRYGMTEKIVEIRKRISGNIKIGMCMGSNSLVAQKQNRVVRKDVKQWPVASQRKLVELCLNSGYTVLLFGGKKEETNSFFDDFTDKSGFFNFINRCDYNETMALLDLCELVVCVDTGLAHTAAALGKVTLTLFGPTDPRQVKPYSKSAQTISLGLACEKCYETERLYDCNENRCMIGIRAEDVFKKIVHMLAEREA